MCGITGIITKNTAAPADIVAMTQGLLHRGPDAHGTFIDSTKTVALGHTRLSIIDLSTEANQPFFSRDGRYGIVFNGEIYNFQEIRKELQTRHTISFRTHSDTEVILEAFAVWKEQMVTRLNGMFAMAIFDQQERKVYLFRDRLGKKPLYYFLSGDTFAFASEIKALLKHPRIRSSAQMDRGVISTFLHLGYIPEPQTIYANIRKFPAGHGGVVDGHLNLTLTSYWDLKNFVSGRKITSVEEASEQLKNLLSSSVQSRLISDVPLGAFLSGGTDSSLVTALAARHTSHPLKTFSIGFSESKFDETRYAREVSKHLKTDHTEYVLTEREGLAILNTYLDHFDEPFSDTSAIPTMLVSRLARQSVKVVLTGDGGDELFLGYGAHQWAARLGSLPWKMIRPFWRGALSAIGTSRAVRVSKLLSEGDEKHLRSHIFSQEQYLFAQREIQSDLLSDRSLFSSFSYEDPEWSKSLTAGERQALFDLHYYLKDDLLVKVDRASMYHALECRCPLLDYRMVEFAFSLDASLKNREGKSKWLLKKLLREYLPDELVDRPKWGFSVPLSRWLRGELSYLVDDYLNDSVTNEVGLFNPGYIAKLIREFKSGQDYLYNRLWALIVLQKWIKDHS